jgi:hypothetical protein
VVPVTPFTRCRYGDLILIEFLQDLEPKVARHLEMVPARSGVWCPPLSTICAPSLRSTARCQALEIVAAAESKPIDPLRATFDIEKMMRLSTANRKADEIGRRMREIIEG